MSNINNGGPAFPSAGDGNETWANEGMTLRDYFAARAMQAIIAKYGNEPPYRDEEDTPDDESARWSYEIADAMLRARSES